MMTKNIKKLNLIENLNPGTRIKLIELESFSINPEIFIELNESIQGEVLQLLSIDSIIKIIKRLESDNAIKILENLEKEFPNMKFSPYLSSQVIIHVADLTSLSIS